VSEARAGPCVVLSARQRPVNSVCCGAFVAVLGVGSAYESLNGECDAGKHVTYEAKKTAQALWIVGPGSAELRVETLPEPGPGQLLVRALYSGISRGTEALVYRHAVPERERERMRAPHQAGILPGPVKYGYASVGEVVQGPGELMGRPVFALFPHQSAYTLAVDQVLLLPDAVPPERAVLAANMETALNALWDAAPLLGQRIVVIGAGVVGCLCAYLAARIPGCQVTLVDIQADRAPLAAALGARFCLPDAAPSGADLVLHASGAPAGLSLALSIAADEASIVELSWYGDQLVSLPLGAAFHPGRLRLVSSQVGSVAPAMRGRRSHRQRLALALSLLDDPALDRLISHEVPFAQLPDALRTLLAPDSRALCARVSYAPVLGG
jgi:threonine dehydrogenase-like Zn-dependent dehydrogenase